MQDLDKLKNEMNLSGQNVYVGHRYVPKIFGEWDNTQIYEPLSIVQYQGASYTSRQFVPVGVELTNEEYWAVTGNYNAQVEQYRQDVMNLGNDTQEVKTQLVQTIARTKSIFDIKTLGIVGDGSIDETDKLQEIVDYSRTENIKVINYDKNLVINISKPIYFDGGEDIDFGYANINKTTNTVGVGYNTVGRTNSSGDPIIDDYAVDAHFIFRHKNNSYTDNVKTSNIHFGTTADNTHDYAIFAPRVQYWEIENVTATNYRFDKSFIFSYSMWQIPKFNNIVYHGGEYLLEIADDGAHIGASTSINANQLYSMGGKGLLRLYSVAYSTFTNVFGHAHFGTPFIFNTCRSTTINSAEIEGINNGEFAYIMNSSITFNSPGALTLKGVPDKFTYLWNIENSKIVINAGKFPDYSEGTPQFNNGLFVNYGSHVTLNQCRMPNNQSGYRGLNEGSSITYIDEKGVTVRTLEGIGTRFNGRKIYNITGMPSSGKWERGDIALGKPSSLGEHMGFVCISSGEFGTEEEPEFARLPSTQPRLLKKRYGTEAPKDSEWWRKGDMLINTEPSANGVFAWVCVTEGNANGQAKFNTLKLTAE